MFEELSQSGSTESKDDNPRGRTEPAKGSHEDVNPKENGATKLTLPKKKFNLADIDALLSEAAERDSQGKLLMLQKNVSTIKRSLKGMVHHLLEADTSSSRMDERVKLAMQMNRGKYLNWRGRPVLTIRENYQPPFFLKSAQSLPGNPNLNRTERREKLAEAFARKEIIDDTLELLKSSFGESQASSEVVSSVQKFSKTLDASFLNIQDQTRRGLSSSDLSEIQTSHEQLSKSHPQLFRVISTREEALELVSPILKKIFTNTETAFPDVEIGSATGGSEDAVGAHSWVVDTIFLRPAQAFKIVFSLGHEATHAVSRITEDQFNYENRTNLLKDRRGALISQGKKLLAVAGQVEGEDSVETLTKLLATLTKNHEKFAANFEGHYRMRTELSVMSSPVTQLEEASAHLGGKMVLAEFFKDDQKAFNNALTIIYGDLLGARDADHLPGYRLSDELLRSDGNHLRAFKELNNPTLAQRKNQLSSLVRIAKDYEYHNMGTLASKDLEISSELAQLKAHLRCSRELYDIDVTGENYETELQEFLLDNVNHALKLISELSE